MNWNSKSKQECVAAFKSLLTDLGIVGSDTFDAVLSRMTADDRFAALKSRAERESALFVYSFSVFFFVERVSTLVGVLASCGPCFLLPHSSLCSRHVS